MKVKQVSKTDLPELIEEKLQAMLSETKDNIEITLVGVAYDLAIRALYQYHSEDTQFSFCSKSLEELDVNDIDEIEYYKNDSIAITIDNLYISIPLHSESTIEVTQY